MGCFKDTQSISYFYDWIHIPYLWSFKGQLLYISMVDKSTLYLGFQPCRCWVRGLLPEIFIERIKSLKSLVKKYLTFHSFRAFFVYVFHENQFIVDTLISFAILYARNRNICLRVQNGTWSWKLIVLKRKFLNKVSYQFQQQSERLLGKITRQFQHLPLSTASNTYCNVCKKLKILWKEKMM